MEDYELDEEIWREHTPSGYIIEHFGYGSVKTYYPGPDDYET